jgi:hypothetical protein
MVDGRVYDFYTFFCTNTEDPVIILKVCTWALKPWKDTSRWLQTTWYTENCKFRQWRRYTNSLLISKNKLFRVKCCNYISLWRVPGAGSYSLTGIHSSSCCCPGRTTSFTYFCHFYLLAKTGSSGNMSSFLVWVQVFVRCSINTAKKSLNTYSCHSCG